MKFKNIPPDPPYGFNPDYADALMMTPQENFLAAQSPVSSPTYPRELFGFQQHNLNHRLRYEDGRASLTQQAMHNVTVLAEMEQQLAANSPASEAYLNSILESYVVGSQETILSYGKNHRNNYRR